MVCAKTNISLIIQDNQDHRELSIKPFLMQIFIASMFLGLVYFYYFSALHYRSYCFDRTFTHKFDLFRKFHSIRKMQSNLIDIKIQFIFCNVILYKVFLNQGLNIIFQLYYDELGTVNIFNMWWISFFLENFGNN